MRTIAEAIETTERFFKLVGVRTLFELQQVGLDALVDKEVIPEQPLAAAAAGRLAPVPLLIGTCHDDYRPYPSILPADVVPQDEGAVVRLFDSLGIDGTHLLRVYREWLGPVAPTEIFVAAMTDATFRQPSIKIAERHAHHNYSATKTGTRLTK